MSETGANATWAGWLEIALNRALGAEPETLEQCGSLEGKLLTLALSDLRREVTVRFSREGMQLSPGPDPRADAIIRGGVTGMLRLASGAGGVAEMSRYGVQVEGDSDLAERFHRILARARPDLEEVLARATGDVVAHAMGYGLRRVGDWVRRGAHTVSEDLADYLRYESGELVPRGEIEGFLADVDRLRDDLARLEARLEALSPVDPEDDKGR
ncbi:MAG TPA: SCP2 sterol-binding domain-containing protein [Gammaproteobacteria bacterium]|nr:SCP2 sterol-binding domain-containing protein [Gammaproteobacteria bacterium]